MTIKKTDHRAKQNASELEAVLQELLVIREEMVANASLSQSRVEEIHPHFVDSARNLLHYLALRSRDVRPLQLRLATLGLSSLGRAEAHVLATVEAVLEVLHRLAGRSWSPSIPEGGRIDFAGGQQLLAQHTEALFSVPNPGSQVRIMVTMPSEAAEDGTLIHDLLAQGMDCMRINCAHDNPAKWMRMIEHLRIAQKTLGLSCKIAMDLAGPKLRTGPLEPGPAIVRIRPNRDAYGRVTAPARIWLTSREAPQLSPKAADACLKLPQEWLSHLRTGKSVKFRDARESKRHLDIVEIAEGGYWAELTRTAYLVPETILRHSRHEAKGKARNAAIGDLPHLENAISLKLGDHLKLTRDLVPGHPAVCDAQGVVVTPATIGCTIPEVFDCVQPGEAIWFDDGKIGGIMEKVEPNAILVKITHARLSGEKLRADKGINFPETHLRLPALTPKDLEDLPFVAEHADIVQLSFANTAEDVESLQQHLARRGNRQPAIVLKIETRRGFENLPGMLLTAMRLPSCGVMIARGDLAVECGFERLAEVQEEILWICEAAHVPVIWATQVLESLSKEGMPSRAEVTDAAMSVRAECVMLNKGPHMVQAVRVLDDILRRMEEHQTKKRPMLRALHLARTLPIEPD